MRDFGGRGSRRKFAQRLLAEAARQDAQNDTSLIVSGGGGGSSGAVISVSGSTTLASASGTVLVNANAGAVTITLPLALTGAFQTLNVKKTDSSANAVTLDASGAETIDGVASVTLNFQYENVTVQSNGTSWFVL